VGAGDTFIVEADEYHRHMLDAEPWGVAITNISADHLDYYLGLADIQGAFCEYASRIPKDGVLVYNADDACTQPVLGHASCRKLSFGFKKGADLSCLSVRVERHRQVFELAYLGQPLGEFSLRIPGKHNLANAMAAALMALHIGVPAETIRASLAEFPGIWRRFEVIGSISGKPAISDYAHHPDGISVTLDAARQFYPGQKILTVFQPHQKSRTQKLHHEFVESLRSCDGLIITEIFSVVGREKVDIQISSEGMAKELQPAVKDVAFAKDLAAAESLILAKISSYDLILFMGAGDIDNLARKLAS
jgi:UDP-N-acetylmuramate--alanine ligase